MGRIVEVSPNISFDEIIATKGAGYKPDFRVFTAGIESDRRNDRLVHMVGSSTEKDLQGDTMSVFALQSMTKAAPNLTVWLNHNYDLPDSIFGSITETPTILHRDGIADLHLNVDVELENPKAAQVKRYIDNGRRLGCSIGCMVTKYEVPEQEDSDLASWGMQPITIHEVYVVEYSVVGIPANQRSWVENAIRGVFTRTLDPSLAPAMKSLWPNAYKEVVKGIDDEGIRKSLDAVTARPRSQHRLDWRATSKTFVLSDGSKEREVSRDAIKALFEGKNVVEANPVVQKAAVEALDTEVKQLGVEDADLTQKDGIPNQIDPHGPVDHSGYDADGDIDNVPETQQDGPWDAEHSLMLHADGLTHDAFNGQHTHEHDSFGYGGTATHSHLHTHLNDNNHNHDNGIAMAAEEGKNVMPDKQASVADTGTPIRAINKDGTEGLILKANGDHQAYSGIHTHHHDSFGHGDVDTHNHEHFHADDNNHEHDHSHTRMGENADSYYAGEPEKTEVAEPTEQKEAPTLPPDKAVLLNSYNALGAALGMPEITPEMALSAQHPVAQPVELPDSDPYAAQFQRLYSLVEELKVTRAPAETVPETQVAAIKGVGDNLALFAKSLDGLGDVLALKKDAEETRATIAVAKKELDAIFDQVKQASATLDALKTMPLGKPTEQSRAVKGDETTVSHEELLGLHKATGPIAHDSISQALAMTEVRSIEVGEGQNMTVRHWPALVGGSVQKGVRPPLTANQISFMDWSEIVAYREGKEADVPYIDNQVSQ